MSLRLASMIAAIFALSAANVEATLIDSFDREDQFFSVSSKNHFNSDKVYPDSAIGGCRDVRLNWESGPRSNAEVVVPDPEVGNGFYFTQGAGGTAIATVVWDGEKDDSGVIAYDLNQDLTQGEADQFWLNITNVTDGMQLKMTVYSSDGALASATAPIQLSAGPTSLSIPYVNFSQQVLGGTSVDFHHVGAIVLELDGTHYAGSDISISSIQTVPEPSTLVLAAMGGVAFFGLRGRRRRA